MYRRNWRGAKQFIATFSDQFKIANNYFFHPHQSSASLTNRRHTNHSICQSSLRILRTRVTIPLSFLISFYIFLLLATNHSIKKR